MHMTTRTWSSGHGHTRSHTRARARTHNTHTHIHMRANLKFNTLFFIRVPPRGRNPTRKSQAKKAPSFCEWRGECITTSLSPLFFKPPAFTHIHAHYLNSHAHALTYTRNSHALPLVFVLCAVSPLTLYRTNFPLPLALFCVCIYPYPPTRLAIALYSDVRLYQYLCPCADHWLHFYNWKQIYSGMFKIFFFSTDSGFLLTRWYQKYVKLAGHTTHQKGST